MGKENAISLLRDRSLKATPTRVDVLSLICAAPNAVSQSTIQSTLQDFDRVTLYRTLNTLVDIGIVHKALVEEDDTFYALCKEECTTHHHDHHHIHFRCEKCKEVTCVENHDLHISLPGHRIHDLEIKASGLCEKCA